NYPFVPVHRIAVQLYISKIGDIKDICSDKICINGRCIKHSNNQEGMSFCHCHQGCGQCVPVHAYLVSNKGFICICSKGDSSE
ncbi:unnamed protein product, partial [Rotaria sp. Silwood1]